MTPAQMAAEVLRAYERLRKAAGGPDYHTLAIDYGNLIHIRMPALAQALLEALEREDALVEALLAVTEDELIMAVDLGMREKFPRSGAFHLEDPMHVIWKAVYEATMAHDARTKGGDSE